MESELANEKSDPSNKNKVQNCFAFRVQHFAEHPFNSSQSTVARQHLLGQIIQLRWLLAHSSHTGRPQFARSSPLLARRCSSTNSSALLDQVKKYKQEVINLEQSIANMSKKIQQQIKNANNVALKAQFLPADN